MPCMLLENVCYFRNLLMVLNLQAHGRLCAVHNPFTGGLKSWVAGAICYSRKQENQGLRARFFLISSGVLETDCLPSGFGRSTRAPCIQLEAKPKRPF